MKTLLVNTSDIEGGAARAVSRIHDGLKNIGVNSELLVQKKQTDLTEVHQISKIKALYRPQFEKLIISKYTKRPKKTWHSGNLLPSLYKNINESEANLVHLNWVANGFMSVSDIKRITKPIIWTLHDMWPLTGGCHYAESCDKYKIGCSSCVQLNSKKKKDLSYKMYERKKKAFKDITIVTPSKWLSDQARESNIFQSNKILTIPNGLDTTIFKPIPTKLARNVLNLPESKKIILFGAVNATSDERKGYDYLKSALKLLENNYNSEELMIVVFGSSVPDKSLKLKYSVNYVGKLNDDTTLAMYYSAADIMCVPSKQEAFGQTITEAMSCETPVVAFNTTGMQDIIDHKINGYLAEAYCTNDFKKGIDFLLKNADKLKGHARDKVLKKYRIEDVAYKYKLLYQEIIGGENG